MNEDTKQEQTAQAEQGTQAPQDDQDFLSGVKACDLSGEGTCEACQ